MKERNAILVLLLASFIWGFAFVAQSKAADAIGPLTYNGIRMLIGAFTLLPLAYGTLKEHIEDKSYMRKLLMGGLLCGLCLGVASVLQQSGIAYTTAGKAGFITSLYILFVPIFSLLLGKRSTKRIWLCVLFGLLGAYMLSISDGFAVSKGDFLIFLCAIVFAIHILIIDHFGKDVNGVELSLMQFLIAGLCCFVLMFIVEKPDFTAVRSAIVPILYSGVMSCGVAYTLQIIGQKYVKPAPATLALSLESVWAAVGGALLLSERMSTREAFGCIILFSSVIIAQIPEKTKF